VREVLDNLPRTRTGYIRRAYSPSVSSASCAWRTYERLCVAVLHLLYSRHQHRRAHGAISKRVAVHR
jgi:hypothetical protein